MIAAIFVSVRPSTKEHWPLTAKISIYCIALVLFLTLVLFEYFVGRPVSDIVRQAVGDSFCGLFKVQSCPHRVVMELPQKGPVKAREMSASLAPPEDLPKEESIHPFPQQPQRISNRGLQPDATPFSAPTSERQAESADNRPRLGTKVAPKLIEALFFNGDRFIAATTSGTKFALIYAPNGRVIREPLDRAGAKGEGIWSLSSDGFCTKWKGGASNCYILVNVDNNKWSVVKGDTTVAVWSK